MSETKSKSENENPSDSGGLSTLQGSATAFLHLPVTEGVIKAALAEYSRGDLSAAAVQNLAGGWLPIATAPKDGTVILTDKGSCAWAAPLEAFTHNYHGWYLCIHGESPQTGDEIYPVFPTHWMKYPSFAPNTQPDSPVPLKQKQIKELPPKDLNNTKDEVVNFSGETGSVQSLVGDARRERLNLGLLTLASWCRSRAMLPHNERTTATMLRKKMRELFAAVDKAGWAAASKAQGKNEPPHLVFDAEEAELVRIAEEEYRKPPWYKQFR